MLEGCSFGDGFYVEGMSVWMGNCCSVTVMFRLRAMKNRVELLGYKEEREEEDGRLSLGCGHDSWKREDLSFRCFNF